VFYSGTVAAAVEGGLRGIPAVAMSLDPRGDVDLTTRFAAALVTAALDAQIAMPTRTVLNINIPAAADGRYRWTTLGERNYDDDVAERRDPRGRPYYWIGGGGVGMGDVPGSDCNAVAEGVISVTPLHLDLTHRGVVDAEPLWSVAGFPYTP
jgi:5'-nucleotidase